MSVKWETKQWVLETVASGCPLFHEFPPPAKRDLVFGLESEYGVGQHRDGEPDFDEARVWKILPNGGRRYRDCDHIEYCTGEEACPLRVTASYEAGKLSSWAAELSPWLDNHSCDGKGHTFGGVHENYARRSSRSTWSQMIPYLVARVVFDGAGCVVLDKCALSDGYSYHLSQRAGHMVAAMGEDTPVRRVFITDRCDEPHMSVPGYDRMHITCGDPHMSPVNMFMKVGMTGMMGELLDMDVLPKVDYDLDCAVTDMRALSTSVWSWDPSDARARWFMRGIRSGSKDVLELLERYLRVAEKYFAGRDIVTDTLLILLEDTFQKLGRNPWELRGRLDWVTKLDILNTFHAAHADDEWIRSQDIEYHLIGAHEADGTVRRGLYAFLAEGGHVERLFSDALLKDAMLEPSPYTRAFFRGRVVQMIEGEFPGDWRLDGKVSNCWKVLTFRHVRGERRSFTVITENPSCTYRDWLPRMHAIFSGGAKVEDIAG